VIILTRHGDPALVGASVEATIQLLSKGSSYEHTKLMEAGVFLVGMRLHQNPSQRQLSLKLLYSVVPHLSHAIILNEQFAEQLFSLFESVVGLMILEHSLIFSSSDPDSNLSQMLCQALANDPRVSGSSVFPELLPMLFETSRMRNPSVSNLLRYLAPDMVPRLIDMKRVDIIVGALTWATFSHPKFAC
jgi:hypothetical protein